MNAANTLSVSDTHVFSPKLVNEARFAVFRQRNQNLGQNRDHNYNAVFGIPYNPPAELQGWPAIRIDGFEEFGDRPNDPFIYDIRNYQFYDVATLTVGNHSFRFGGDIIRANYVESDVRNTRGDFRFRGRSTNPAGGVAGSTSSGFRSFADFLLGLPDATQLQVGADPADLVGTQYAFFVQDNWRFNERLTLNLGLRYELQQPLTEATGRLATFIPELREVVLSGDLRFPEALLETDKNNFGPRVGFALRLFGNGRTVLRGGAGIYHSLESFNVTRQQVANNFPFLNRVQYNRPFVSATSTTRNPVGLTFTNPFPAGTVAAANDTFGIDTENRTPEFYQYNLTLERELARDLALEIGYVGSQGRYLGRRYNINQSFSVRNANGTFYSINPFNAQFNAPDVGQQRPDLVGHPYQNIPAGLFFNPAAFGDPSDSVDPNDPLNLFGNAGRNILTGPSFKNFNLSLLKNIRLREGLRLQFRAEALNVFNHPNFQVPVFFLDRADVGQVTSTSNEGRELQFALKLIF